MDDQRRKELLTAQIADWQKRELLTEDLAELLRLDVQSGIKTTPFIQRNLIKIVTYVGGFLIGLGILLFVASNWSGIPKSSKVFLIFFVVIIVHSAAIYIRTKYVKNIFANILHLIGTFAAGGGIFLLGQIFHISGDGSDAFLLIALGSIPLAYAASARPILSVGIGAFYIFLGITLFSNSLLGQSYPILYTLIGISVYAIGVLQEKFNVPTNLNATYRNFGSLTILATLLVASFRYAMPTNNILSSFGQLPPTIIGLIVIGIIASIASFTISISKNDKTGLFEIVGFGILLLGVVIQMSFAKSPELSRTYYQSGWSNFEYLLFANLTLIGAIILIFVLGALKRSKALINIALIGTVATIFARYADLFASFMGRSIAFIIGGIILLAIGYILEKKRKDIYRQLHIES